MIKNYVFFCGLILSAAAGPTEYFPIKLGQAYVVGTDCPHDWNKVTSTGNMEVLLSHTHSIVCASAYF